jgi:hypothetical protein
MITRTLASASLLTVARAVGRGVSAMARNPVRVSPETRSSASRPAALAGPARTVAVCARVAVAVPGQVVPARGPGQVSLAGPRWETARRHGAVLRSAGTTMK